MSTPADTSDHERCGAKTRSGTPCKQAAGHGTDHVGIGCCKLHGGSTRNHVRSAELVKARMECERLGVPVEIDPGEALIRAVWEAEGNLAFYRAQVQNLALDIIDTEFGAEGAMRKVPNALVVLYHQAEERRVSIAAAALRAGVEERRVRMAESDARTMFTAVGKALDAANLTPEQVEVIRSVLAQSLREPTVDAGGLARSTGEPVPA